MKKILVSIRIVMLMVISIPLPVGASFEDLGAGARAPGMVDVFVGVADSADTIYYNPAGLTQLKLDEISTHYGQLLRGTDDGSSLATTYLAGAHRLRQGKLGVLGFAYNNFKAQSLFSERTLTLGYGWKLKVLPFGIKGVGSMGFNIKQLHRQFEPDRYTENALNDAGSGSNSMDPLFSRGGYAKDAYAADLGTLVHFGPAHRASLGAMLQNINQPDVSLGNDGDRALLSARLGGAYRFPWGLFAIEARRTTRIENTVDNDLGLAIERNFAISNDNQVSIRGGYATGSRNYKALATGFSYQFSKARIDYAFTFPISSLPGSDGGHRLGLSIQLGSNEQSSDESEKQSIDLLQTFSHDSSASHAVMTRGFTANETPIDIQELGYQLLISKYPMDDHSTKIHQQLSRIATTQSSKVFEWPELREKLVRLVSKDDALNFGNTLDIFVKGDPSMALARLGLLSDMSRHTPIVKTIQMAALAELAAQSYRDNNIDTSINHMRQILEMMPQDPIVVDAYRKLLLMRTQQTPTEQIMPKTRELPDAPVALRAPQPQTGQQSQEKLAEKDALLRGYGEQMGYYYTRKTEGASAEEKRILLNQIKSLYSDKNIDLSLLNRELSLIPEKAVVIPVTSVSSTSTTMVLPTPKPTISPTPVRPSEPTNVATIKPSPTPLTVAQRQQVSVKYNIAIKAPVPEIVRSPELASALLYYRQAVLRGISDHERIEIMESIILRFGEPGASEIGKELERIRKRIAR